MLIPFVTPVLDLLHALTVASGLCPDPITNVPGIWNRSPFRQGSIEAKYSARTERRVDSSNREYASATGPERKTASQAASASV